MKNNRVKELWSALEKERLPFVKRLISSDFRCSVYCTYQYPDNYFGIALSYDSSISINLKPFIDYSEMKIRIFPDMSFSGNSLLSVQLTESRYKNIFSYLCTNVVENIAGIDDEKKAVDVLLNSLAEWKQLFGRARSKGLSQEEQQGLYGELYLLERLLSTKKLDWYEVVELWVGSDRALRDFQRKDCAVECKTTTSSNPQQLTINGERQLDDSMIGALYLFHLSLEASKNSGENLVERVDSVRDILKYNIPALDLLEAKLFEAGYMDFHAERYKDRAYKTRNEYFYQVTGDFPRIRESELRQGVGSVHYGIVLAHCESYLVEEKEVIDKLLLS